MATATAPLAIYVVAHGNGGGGDERARKVEAIRAALVEGEQSGNVGGSSLAALQ